ncbi:hypothetical protein D9M68_702630 [compost metagenome]
MVGAHGRAHRGRRRVGRLHADAHAGQHARQFLHVGLRVAAAHAQRVQLHELACVVLVDAVGGVLRVVEVAQHGRVPRGSAQQVAELAKRVRANRVLLVVADHRAHQVLADADVEMVHPEPGHLLLQLVGRIQRAQQKALLRLAREGVEFLLVGRACGLLRFFVGQGVGGLAPGIEREDELVERRARDGHGVDLRLRRRGQRTRRGAQLPAHPARQAVARKFGLAAGVGAPAHTVEPAQLRSGRVGGMAQRRERRALGAQQAGGTGGERQHGGQRHGDRARAVQLRRRHAGDHAPFNRFAM